MKKSNFSLFSVIIAVFFTSSPLLNAQQLVFNKGHWIGVGDPELDNFQCNCGQATYNCICGLNIYSPTTSVGHVLDSQIHVVVSSQTIKGNTLVVKFDKKLGMRLKKRDFLQKEEIPLSPEVASTLGYDLITILPGKYAFKCRKKVTFNVRLGKKKG